MAGGIHTWQHAVTLGGVNVTARCRGALWHRQELSAAHLGRVRLALAGTDPDAEADAATGLALVITVAWDGGAPRPWFSGIVQLADYDEAEGVLVLEASDRLQEWAEAQTEAAIDAAAAGSLRVAEVQEARRDGWTQLLSALKTLQAGYAIGRDGVHRVIPWAPGTPAASLGAGQVRYQGVARQRRPLRGLVNRVIYRVVVRGVRLSRWIVRAGCGSTGTYCQWAADPWVRPPITTLQDAILAAGPVYRTPGIVGVGGDTGGIGYTLPPPTGDGTMNCTGTPTQYWQDPTVALSAWWQWELRSRQLVSFEYALQLDCEASQAAWGVLADERDATLDLSGEYSGWESSADGSPAPQEWEAAPGGSQWCNIPRAREIAVIESALAEGAATIAGTHRQDLVMQVLPWQAQNIDLYHTVSWSGGTTAWIGVPEVIEGLLDVGTWEASTTITLRRPIPLPGGVSDALVAPARPEMPATYTIEHDITFPWRIGGRTGVPLYDGAWEGVTTNYITTDPESAVYPYKARFVRPAVPDGARASITINSAPVWRVVMGA